MQSGNTEKFKQNFKKNLSNHKLSIIGYLLSITTYMEDSDNEEITQEFMNLISIYYLSG